MNIQGASSRSIEGDNILTCDVAPPEGGIQGFVLTILRVILLGAEPAIAYCECWM